MKRTTLAFAITSAFLAQPTYAAQDTYIIDISDNLYYSGLIPERKQHPFTGVGAKPGYSGSFVPSEGYPTDPVPYLRYQGTPIGDCMRNVYYVDVDGNERIPAGADSINTFAPDDRVSCFGTPPVVVTLADHGVSAGDTLHIQATGIIDDDTELNFGPGGGIAPVDPRGQQGSDTASDNDINQYSAIGVFAKAPSGESMLETDQNFMDYVDAAWQSGDIWTGAVGNPGFDVIPAVEGDADQREFGVVADLNLTQTSTFVDLNTDLIADEGTGEFAGSITVPTGATHLILAYNAHQGGFYHHGDTRYFGADHPLVTGTNPAGHQVTQAKLEADGIYRSGGYTVTANHVDQYPTDGVAAADGSTRTVGVFKVTLSDQPITGVVVPVVPAADIDVTTTNELQVSVDGTGSTISEGTIDAYSWNFGDGSTAETGSTASHTYATAGTYTVSLTVTSDGGQSNTTTQSVTVTTAAAPATPVADVDVTKTNLAITVSGTGSSISTGSIASYSWDFGDSSAAATGSTASHTYAAAGTYTVTLTVTSDQGQTDTETESVTVTAASTSGGGGGGSFGLGLLALLPLGNSLVRRRRKS